MEAHPLFNRRAVIATAIASAATHAAGQPRSATISSDRLVSRWREARAISGRRSNRGILNYTGINEGLPTTLEISVSTDGARFHRVLDRGFDRDEVLLRANIAERRDWNGFVRPLAGQELSSLRTEAFIAAALAFGPPQALQHAAAAISADGAASTLTHTPPGGHELVWRLDARSGLPIGVSSVDGEIGVSDWRPGLSAMVPRRLNHGEQASYTLARAEPTNSELARLRRGPSDVFMLRETVTLPFTLEANHIVIQTRVNGGDPIGFLLDTGAGAEIANAARLGELGLRTYGASQLQGGGGSASSSYVRDVTFGWPDLELRAQHATAIDLSGLERAWGVPIGGILGYDFISRFIVEIDHAHSVLHLHRPERWRYDGDGTIIPLVISHGLPYADVSISVPTRPNIPANVVIDLGASDTMILTAPFVIANDLVALASNDPTVNPTAGLEREFFAQRNISGRLENLQIGDLQLRDLPVSFSANTVGAYASSAFAGVIGEGLLRRFNVILDYSRNRLILEPGPDALAPFPPRRSFGLTLLAGGPELKTFTVAAVRSSSPASAAGFIVGDVIVAVDDRQASQLTLSELRTLLAREGNRLRFQIDRSGQSLIIEAQIAFVALH